ncbi:MAG: alpha-galactosidase, partial [Pontixanthobacter sp.]
GDGVRFLLWLIRTDNPDERRDPPLPLPFTAGADWHVSLLRYASADGPATQHIPRAWSMGSDPLPLTGDWLARAGLPIPTLPAESAAIFLLERRP